MTGSLVSPCLLYTSFGMGKTATLSTLGNKSRGIRKHSSTDEYNYFQGMAVSYKSVSYTHLDVYKRQYARSAK